MVGLSNMTEGKTFNFEINKIINYIHKCTNFTKHKSEIIFFFNYVKMSEMFEIIVYL